MYKFIIFGSSNDYDSVIYGQKKIDNFKYIKKGREIDNFLLRGLNRVHLSRRFNRKIDLPFKNIWNPYYLNKLFENGPYCFIFFPSRDYFREVKYFDYLKENYPDSKLVLFCRDLIKTHKKFDINYYKANFDLVLTYDQEEAKRYNIEYVNSVYSTVDTRKVDNDPIKSDIFFIGKDKGRLNKIIELYERLTDCGIICDFYIIGVNERNQKYSDKINYNKKLSYLEVVNKIQGTNCILEIIQDNSSAYTLRTLEAIFYNKKLLTNNKTIRYADFYEEDKINIINYKNQAKIDFNFIRNRNFIYYDDSTRKKFSLNEFLNRIKELL
jgi:hypothetical protein